MYIDYRLRQRHRQPPAGILVLRSCGTSQRNQYYFKVNLVNFWLFDTFFVFYHKVDDRKHINTKNDHRTPINKEFID